MSAEIVKGACKCRRQSIIVWRENESKMSLMIFRVDISLTLSIHSTAIGALAISTQVQNVVRRSSVVFQKSGTKHDHHLKQTNIILS